ncbi:hypothetical protein RUM43_014011 [Polyplax serrata]|uniref:Uncharacterized protein n=1 Tax=Polyplax serrata TaxID=468196 RepID=A0AAN8NJ72_POLSC
MHTEDGGMHLKEHKFEDKRIQAGTCFFTETNSHEEDQRGGRTICCGKESKREKERQKKIQFEHWDSAPD